MSYNTFTPIVTDGLVLYLDAANTKSYPGNGTSWLDLSKNGSTISLINNPTFNSNNGGNIVFNGINQYGSTPSTSLFNFGSNNFTIDVWCFFDASTSTDDTYRYLFNFQTPTTLSYLLLSKWRSNGLLGNTSNGVYLDYSVAGSRYTITTSNLVPSPNIANTITSPLYDVPNKWSNFIISVSSNVMSLYINGVLYGSVSLGSRWNSNTILYLGTYDTTSSVMKGLIPNFKVYNRALSASEVLQNYNATKFRYL
jgi:hypothetical protein